MNHPEKVLLATILSTLLLVVDYAVGRVFFRRLSDLISVAQDWSSKLNILIAALGLVVMVLLSGVAAAASTGTSGYLLIPVWLALIGVSEMLALTMAGRLATINEKRGRTRAALAPARTELRGQLNDPTVRGLHRALLKFQLSLLRIVLGKEN